MDIKTLSSVRFTPTFNDNDKSADPFTVIHKSLRREWQIKAVEESHAVSEALRLAKEAGGDEFARKYRGIAKRIDSYNKDMLAAHVIGSEGLTVDGKPATREELLQLLEDVQPLTQEVAKSITDSGSMTEDEAKN